MINSSENKDTINVFAGWKKEDFQKRDFAAITDATSIILKKINFPPNRREFVCALQGVGNGREKFPASHLVLARRIGHRGKKKTAETSVYRELQALKSFQTKSQIILFDIEQGGGAEKKRTEYEDYLTRAAVFLVNRATKIKAENPEMKKAPLGKVMESIVGEALEILPPYAGSRLEQQASKPKISYFRQMNKAKFKRLETYRERLSNTISLCLSEFDAQTEPEELREFARLVAGYITRTAEDIITAQNGVSLNLLDMVTTSDSSTLIKYDNAAGNNDGLQNSSPLLFMGEQTSKSDLLIKSDSLTGLSLTPAEPINFIIESALGYARRGWKIVPLHTPDENNVCSCNRGESCHSSGKHPRTARGVKEAASDETKIKDWWNRFENTNIGIACGAESGIICLDIDPRSGGDETLKRLTELYGELPSTFEVETGGGGKHFLFKYPQGISVKNSSGKLGDGLDIKSDNGFIVAAPSRHASGNCYRVLNDSEPAPLPDWLLQTLCNEEKKVRNFGNETIRLSQTVGIGAFQGISDYIIPAGIRNEKLFKVACAMVGRSEEPAKITAEIERINTFNCSPPLAEDEIQGIIKSAFRYGPDTN